MELFGQILTGFYAVLLVVGILGGPLVVNKPRKPMTLRAWATTIVINALVLATLVYAYWI